jgi:ribokinase
MDLVVRTPHLPAPGETISGGPFATYPGGKGANQAVAAARLGGRVAMVGCVGGDAFGATLRDGLEREGIDISEVRVRPTAASGIALITVQEDGQNTIVIASGANGTLTAEAIEAAKETIAAARVLVLQLETPLPAVQRAAELARAAGALVVLNPAPAQPLPPALLAQVDYLIPNQHEAAMLLGQEVQGLPDAEQSARLLRSVASVGHVVITLGAEGALLVGNDERLLRVQPHAVTPLDATAAGDAFVGAFAVALAEGRAPIEALRLGNAAGALAVTRAGAQPSLPARAEVEALLRS